VREVFHWIVGGRAAGTFSGALLLEYLGFDPAAGRLERSTRRSPATDYATAGTGRR
jgi:hypothetical protein